MKIYLFTDISNSSTSHFSNLLLIESLITGVHLDQILLYYKLGFVFIRD